MRARRTATTGVAAAALVLAAAAPATALAPAKAGWWSVLSAGGASAPAPTTPEGGLHVTQGPAGPTAFGGVEYVVGEAVGGATLVLAVSAGSTLGTPDVMACPTRSAWRPGGNQPMEAAPVYDCASEGVHGVVDAVAATVTFLLDVRQLRGSSYSLAVVPAPGAAPFSIDFAPPGPASMTVAPAELPPPGAEPVPSPAEADPGPAAAPAGSPPVLAGPALPPAPVFGPVVPAPAPATVVAPAPQTAPQDVAAAPSARAAAAVRPTEPDRGSRTALVLLVLLFAAFGWAMSQPQRRPVLLGGLARTAGAGGSGTAAVVTGGIGRFARQRSGPPRRLL